MNTWMNPWMGGLLGFMKKLIQKILCEYEQIISTINKQKTWNAWIYLCIIEGSDWIKRKIVKYAEWATHEYLCYNSITCKTIISKRKHMELILCTCAMILGAKQIYFGEVEFSVSTL